MNGRLGLATSAAIALLVALGGTARAEVETLWRALPLAELVRRDLEPLDLHTLVARAEALRQRLFIDETTIAIERGEDLELAIGYAAAVTLLAERGASTDNLLGARRSAAYLLHATGVMAERDPHLRLAVVELGALEDEAARALARSVKAMRAWGREAFAAALAEQRARGEALSAAALAQAGHVALAEGDALGAAVSFVEAAGQEALPRLGWAACEALAAVGDARALTMCREIEARFVTVLPASRSGFEAARRRGEARREGVVAASADEDARRLVALVERAVAQGLGRRRALGAAERAALEAALGAYETTSEDGRRAARALRAVVALAAFVAREEGAEARLEAALEAVEEDDGAEDAREVGLGARLRLVAGLLGERWEEARAHVLGRAGRQERAAITRFIARVELGLGVRTRDRARIEAALAVIEGGAEGEGEKNGAARLAAIVGRRALEVASGEALGRERLGEDRRALGEMTFTFDVETQSGRALAQSVAFTLATLEARDGAHARAGELLREARRFGGELGPLAAGLAQLVTGDAAGAAELCARGAVREPALRQALLTCEALGAEEASAMWRAAEALWDAAFLPQILRAGTARAVFVPDLELGAGLDPEGRVVARVRLEPVVVLLPEPSPARVEVRRKAGL